MHLIPLNIIIYLFPSIQLGSTSKKSIVKQRNYNLKDNILSKTITKKIDKNPLIHNEKKLIDRRVLSKLPSKNQNIVIKGKKIQNFKSSKKTQNVSNSLKNTNEVKKNNSIINKSKENPSMTSPSRIPILKQNPSLISISSKEKVKENTSNKKLEFNALSEDIKDDEELERFLEIEEAIKNEEIEEQELILFEFFEEVFYCNNRENEKKDEDETFESFKTLLNNIRGKISREKVISNINNYKEKKKRKEKVDIKKSKHLKRPSKIYFKYKKLDNIKEESKEISTSIN